MRIPLTISGRARRGAWLVPWLLVACGDAPPAAPSPQALQIETFTITADASPAARVWDGVVESTRNALLSAQTSGRMTTVAVDVDDAIAAGQVLARITATEQTATTDSARAGLRAAEAQLLEAEGRFRRASDLVERQLISRQDHEQVRAARDSAVAARDAAAARLAQAGEQLAYTTVRAPFAGVVSRRLVEPGETVAAGQPLLEVHDPRSLRVEVQLPQGDAQAIRATPQARVLHDAGSIDAGRVIVYPAADPASHSVTVRVMLPEANPVLRPGETVKVAFPAAGGAVPVVWIPAGAVQRRGELTSAYVVDENALRLRQLRLGRSAGDRVEVIAGLAPGERIALDPVAALEALAAQRAASGAPHE